MHVVLIIFLIYGLPSLSSRKIAEPQVITIEVIPISSITNVNSAKQNTQPKPKTEENIEKKKNIEKAVEKPTPAVDKPIIEPKKPAAKLPATPVKTSPAKQAKPKNPATVEPAIVEPVIDSVALEPKKITEPKKEIAETPKPEPEPEPQKVAQPKIPAVAKEEPQPANEPETKEPVVKEPVINEPVVNDDATPKPVIEPEKTAKKPLDKPKDEAKSEPIAKKAPQQEEKPAPAKPVIEDKKPEPKPTPEPKSEPKKLVEKTQPKQVTQEKEVEKVVEKKPTPKPQPVKKKLIIKPEAKNPEVKKPKEMSFDDIASLVNNLDVAKKKPVKQKKTSPSKTSSDSDNYDPSIPLSISERNEIRRQIENQWIPPIGSRGLRDMKVNLKVQLSQDGVVKTVRILNSKAQLSNRTFRALAESGQRAAWKASPIKNLPKNKYHTWKIINLNFDASNLY